MKKIIAISLLLALGASTGYAMDTSRITRLWNKTKTLTKDVYKYSGAKFALDHILPFKELSVVGNTGKLVWYLGKLATCRQDAGSLILRNGLEILKKSGKLVYKIILTEQIVLFFLGQGWMPEAIITSLNYTGYNYWITYKSYSFCPSCNFLDTRKNVCNL